MTINTETITRERAMALLDYHPDTGLFHWRVPKSLRVKPGDVAGTTDDKGYVRIMIDYRWYRAARLAWLITHGVLPVRIDHINGVKDDNRIENLREATVQQNNQNAALRRDSTTGCPGVSKHRSGYQARIYVDGGSKSLGLFKSLEEACATAAAARREAFGQFARRAAA